MRASYCVPLQSCSMRISPGESDQNLATGKGDLIVKFVCSSL